MRRNVLFCVLVVTLGLLNRGVASESISVAKTLLKVEDFGLFDHQGKFHRLRYYESDPETKAILLFVQGNGCPLVRKRIPQLHKLQAIYEPKGIRFWMLNANPQDSRIDILEEVKEFDIQIPVLIDDSQLVAEELLVTRTAEALLIDTSNWMVCYRGAVDDRLSYESEKPAADHHYLKDAMEALLAGQSINMAKTDSPGCKIAFTEKRRLQGELISYTDTIVPILQKKCVNCHSRSGIGPFAMSSHQKLAGWAEMIREVVMTRRMPPWQADPYHGSFSNDLSLSAEEKQSLIRWIDQGTPKNAAGDLLEDLQVEAPTWPLGAPDEIVDIPAQSVQAVGILDYRYLTLDSPFEEDVWISGVELLPGNTKVLHHTIAWIIKPNERDENRRKWLAGYAPGMTGQSFPKATGILFRKNEKLLFELHYTPYGKAVIDQSKLGLYLAKEPVKTALRTGVFIDERFKIPPQVREHQWSRSHKLGKDIILFGMNPHMHLRGKSMQFEARYPDGKSEILLSVPYYNFNWQRYYNLTKPKRLPQGTRLFLHAAWDNSSLNKANPDPNRAVRWGEQSFDEMFFGTYQYVLAEQYSLEDSDTPLASVE